MENKYLQPPPHSMWNSIQVVGNTEENGFRFAPTGSVKQISKSMNPVIQDDRNINFIAPAYISDIEKRLLNKKNDPVKNEIRRIYASKSGM